MQIFQNSSKDVQFFGKYRVILLSFLCVFAFASSWIIIGKQVKSAGFLWPLALRFFIASLLLMIWAYLARLNLKLSYRQQKAILIQSFLMFSLNFIAIYAAAQYLYSGVNSLVSASVAVFNIFVSSFLFKKPLSYNLLLSSFLGLLGLSLILSLDYLNLLEKGLSSKPFLFGVFLGFVGALITSFGQVYSVRLKNMGIGALEMNTFGMFYGSILTSMIALATEGLPSSLLIEQNLASLFYIALVPTALGFLLYFKLLEMIGPERSAYIFIVAPAIALVISSLYEGYDWQELSSLGLFLIILGQILRSSRFSTYIKNLNLLRT